MRNLLLFGQLFGTKGEAKPSPEKFIKWFERRSCSVPSVQASPVCQPLGTVVFMNPWEELTPITRLYWSLNCVTSPQASQLCVNHYDSCFQHVWETSSSLHHLHTPMLHHTQPETEIIFFPESFLNFADGKTSHCSCQTMCFGGSVCSGFGI